MRFALPMTYLFAGLYLAASGAGHGPGLERLYYLTLPISIVAAPFDNLLVLLVLGSLQWLLVGWAFDLLIKYVYARSGRSKPQEPRCRHCGYPLKGLPTDLCPECGKASKNRGR